MQNMRNHIQLIGNLSKEIDYRQLADGNTIARTSLATREVHRSRDGKKSVDVQWHHLVGWGKVAEMMQVLLNKGNQVAIQGRLVHRSFNDEYGQKQFRTEIVINEFMLI